MVPPAKRPDAVRCGSPGDPEGAGGFWRTAASLVGHDGLPSLPPSLLAVRQNPLRPGHCGSWVRTLSGGGACSSPLPTSLKAAMHEASAAPRVRPEMASSLTIVRERRSMALTQAAPATVAQPSIPVRKISAATSSSRCGKAGATSWRCAATSSSSACSIRWSGSSPRPSRLAVSLLPLFFPIAAGISLLGSIVAIGFYELARRREEGLESDWSHFFDVRKRPSADGLGRGRGAAGRHLRLVGGRRRGALRRLVGHGRAGRRSASSSPACSPPPKAGR